MHILCYINESCVRIYNNVAKSKLCNISKTSASVSSGFPNTEKVMKARGRRPSALEPLMKHDSRGFDMASQMKQ